MESIVDCKIYSLKYQENNQDSYYQGLLIELNDFIVENSKDYLWHYEPFRLNFHSHDELPVTMNINVHQQRLQCLESHTQVDESIEDEMFIVHLLRQMSLKYHDLVISVKDSEGEFLMIEAADDIPFWMNPETVENRVFIYQGSVHIIPLPTKPSDIGLLPSGQLKIQDALQIISDPNIDTKASEKLNQSPFNKCGKTQELHRAKCRIPIAIAYLLSNEPQLVSFAVHAFHSRDAVSMKHLSSIRKFCPSQSKFVTVLVQFTRMQYAMLKTAKFYPPKGFPMNENKEEQEEGEVNPIEENSKLFRAAELGMKLTCGFEMFYAEMKREKQRSSTGDEKEWLRYQEKLEQLGYFQGELKGSKLHRELELKAKEEFIKSKTQKHHHHPFQPMIIVDNLLSSMPAKDMEAQLINDDLEQGKEDDEEWLKVTLDDLNTEETSAFEIKHDDDGSEDVLDFDEYDELNEEDKNDFEDLANILKGFKSFIAGEGDLEGAMIPGDEVLVNEDEEDNFSETNSDVLSFDADRFLNTMKEILGFPDEKEKENEQLQPNLKQTMDIMDRELQSYHKLTQGFEKCHVGEPPENTLNDGHEDDESQPVHVDANLLKNILDSFAAQEGLPGPASNLLGSLGVKLPKIEPRKEE